MNYKDILYKKNSMIILSYLSKIKTSIYGKMLSNELGLSQSSISSILKDLEIIGLVSKEIIGQTILYKVDKKSTEIKEFRIFENILDLKDLVNQLKYLCREIVLFGSCAKGVDTIDSDIDLFIVADQDNYDNIRKIITSYISERLINPIIVDTIELMSMEESDKVFIKEVNNGIKLYSGEDI